MYATKDTYISTALTAGVNTAWLEAQTGVRYETLRRHYGKWLRTEGLISSRRWPHWPPIWPPQNGGAAKCANCRRYESAKGGT